MPWGLATAALRCLPLLMWVRCCERRTLAVGHPPCRPAAGTYRLLPAVIEEELVQPGQRLERPGELSEQARAARRTDALRRLDFLLRSKLLAVRAVHAMRAAAAAACWCGWRMAII